MDATQRVEKEMRYSVNCFLHLPSTVFPEVRFIISAT